MPKFADSTQETRTSAKTSTTILRTRALAQVTGYVAPSPPSPAQSVQAELQSYAKFAPMCGSLKVRQNTQVAYLSCRCCTRALKSTAEAFGSPSWKFDADGACEAQYLRIARSHSCCNAVLCCSSWPRGIAQRPHADDFTNECLQGFRVPGEVPRVQ